MPQQRQRIVFCDCLDCVQQPATTDIASSTSAANEAAAKQEPPPKCLMFVLSGVLLAHPQQQQQQQQQQQGASRAGTLLDSCNLPHFNRATAQGNLCLLTVRESSAADCCAELAQLLNVYEEFEQRKPPGSLADKFKGMQASFASNSSAAAELAAACGLSASHALEADQADEAAAAAAEGAAAEGLPAVLAGGSGVRQRHGRTAAAAAAAAAAAGGPHLPDPAEAARRILLELGLQQADAGLDMVVLHLDAASSSSNNPSSIPQQQRPQDQQQQQQQQQSQEPPSLSAAVELLAWLDRTLRYLNNSSAFKDTVLLTVVATPGAAGALPAAVPLLQAAGGVPVPALSSSAAQQKDKHSQQEQQQQQQQRLAGTVSQGAVAVLQPAGRPVLQPLQSWQQLGGEAIAVDARRPLLCMRRLPGVIRRDGCNRFSLAECCSSSGVLGLLADRLLPEVAYKLGRAPKYGA